MSTTDGIEDLGCLPTANATGPSAEMGRYRPRYTSGVRTEFSLPPAACDIPVHDLPPADKLVGQLAKNLDILSATELNWRGLFGELQDRYPDRFPTSDIQLYNMQYLRTGGSPAKELLFDLGSKTPATAQDLNEFFKKNEILRCL